MQNIKHTIRGDTEIKILCFVWRPSIALPPPSKPRENSQQRISTVSRCTVLQSNCRAVFLPLPGANVTYHYMTRFSETAAAAVVVYIAFCNYVKPLLTINMYVGRFLEGAM